MSESEAGEKAADAAVGGGALESFGKVTATESKRKKAALEGDLFEQHCMYVVITALRSWPRRFLAP